MKGIFNHHLIVAMCAFLVGLAAGCSKLSIPMCPETRCNGPVTVTIGVGRGVDAVCTDGTRTSINSDGRSVSWDASDRIALWAMNSSGEYVLSNQTFNLLGSYSSEAVFTSTIPEPMPEGRYSYFMTYPRPLRVSGTTLSFEIQSVQDGAISGGLDIMAGGPAEGAALKQYDADDRDCPKVHMTHLTHVLKFYLPEDSEGLGGEPVREMRVTMPEPVCGTFDVDMSDPLPSGRLSDGTGEIRLRLSSPISPSTAAGREYACAAVAPFSYTGAGKMHIVLYSDSFIAETGDIDVSGRTFQAGHTTAVKLNVTNVKPLYRLKFMFNGNNIGEPIYRITLTAPSGCVFAAGGSNVYTYEPGGEIPVGTELEFTFTDESLYRAFNGQNVQAAFDSEHVLAYRNVTPATSSGHSCTLPIPAPYLLYEDFSELTSFSSYDVYKTSSAGGKDGYGPFLGGWTGERIGGQAGTSVRLAARRETSVRYHSRMDSAPLPQIKSPVNIKVSFDYGMGEDHGGILSKQYGMNVFVGYVTSTKMYDNGSTTGTFNHSFNINDTQGSYTNITDHADVLIENIPAGTENRISWRAEVENHAGANNNTDWLYLDNVTVQVAR